MAFTIPDELASPYSHIHIRQVHLASTAIGVPLRHSMTDDPDVVAYLNNTNVVFNRKQATERPYLDVAFILCHEYLHYLFGHHYVLHRWQTIGTVRGKLADGTEVSYPFHNVTAQHALDYVNNDALVRSKVAGNPPDMLHDVRIASLSDTEEDAYVRTFKKNPPTDQSCQSQPGDQPGGKPGAGGSDVMPVDPNTDPNGATYRAIILDALPALAKAAGLTPAEYERLCDRVMPDRTNWREFIRLRCKTYLGGPEEAWSPYHRGAFAMRMVMPGRIDRRAGFVTLTIDTSGSIGADEQAQFISALMEMWRQTKPKRLIVLEVDARVHGDTEITNLSAMERFAVPVLTGKKGLRGGGGTNMKAAHQWLIKHGLKPDLHLYFTDMHLYDGFPDGLGNAREVIWCATTALKAPKEAGHTVRVWAD